MSEPARFRRCLFLLCLALPAVGVQAHGAEGGAAASPVSLEVALKPDVPSGYPDRVGRFETPLRQDLTSLQLTRLGDGKYALRFSSGTDVPSLPEIDLRPFIPRIPLLAKGDPGLVRIALIQRELNRNQTRYPAPGRPETVFVSNNCLKGGLWEIGLDRKDDKGALTYYHGWFTFPKDEYAKLFETLNGVPYASVTADLDSYPKLDGIPVPLDKMRSVLRELPVPAVDSHLGEPIDRFPEQERKAKLVLAPNAQTYGDWSVADRQPMTTAKFSEPGFYDSKDPMRFNLSWLGQPAEARWRWVRSAGTSDDFPEIEVRYGNGYRLVLADSRLAGLPARSAKPTDEADLLHLTFGIETPEIYAGADERLRELGSERPAYLFLLDAKGDLVDNHHAGLDRIYLWREAGSPERLHLYLVGYERIALVGHLSFAWPSDRPLSAAEPQFRFQDNVWVNLHHFVRVEARRRAFKAPLVMPMSSLSEAERTAWSSAVDAYADLANLDPVFDERLFRINNALASQGEAATLPEGLIEPGVLAALNRAAPVYRAHLWSEHRRLNEEWIAATRPLVEQHAPSMPRALAEAYHVQWPTEPILVDVSIEAGRVGAYTTGGPPGFAAHTTIAPANLSDPAMSFEIVFHEASHSVDEQIMKHVDAEAAKQKIKPNPNLWHAILFYTSGELVKRELHKEKEEGYKPYAYRFGVYDRGWQSLRAGLEQDWQPYLDGKVGFGPALAKLVSDCPAPVAEAPKKSGSPQ